MSEARDAIFAWAGEGRLPAAAVSDALRVAGVTPDAAAWRGFIDRLLLGFGAALCAIGVIFFIAANWRSLGRFQKFGLVELSLVAAVAVCLWQGLAARAGKAALVAAALLAGGLLALVGQVYQTGADTYELFAAWAFAILAWVAVARMPSLWLLWLAILDIGIVFFFSIRPSRLALDSTDMLVALFALDALALAVWETLSHRGCAWLRAAWATRALAFAAGAAITAAVTVFVFERHFAHAYTLVLYFAWMAGLYWVYRQRSVDLLVLGGLVLSVAVVAAALSLRLFEGMHYARILLTGLVISGIATVGARWLRRVALEEHPA